jgi:hypothetical protein
MLRSPRARCLTVLALSLSALPVLAAGEGKLVCEITENGKLASGTIVVLQGTTELARAACGKPLSVPIGEHAALLTLDGALDAPEQRQPLRVQADKPIKITADFATGMLEVHITSQGHDTAGMAVIRKDGRQIGTLGSGVSAHLSTATYQVVARYRTQERRFEKVLVQKGQQTVLDANFE